MFGLTGFGRDAELTDHEGLSERERQRTARFNRLALDYLNASDPQEAEKLARRIELYKDMPDAEQIRRWKEFYPDQVSELSRSFYAD